MTPDGWAIPYRCSEGSHASVTAPVSAKGQMADSWQGRYNGQLATYTITSNAINALTFSGTTSPITAALRGKGSGQRRRDRRPDDG